MPTNDVSQHFGGSVPPVASIMTRDPITVQADESLDDAMSLMDAHSIRHLIVLRDGQPVGLLSDREVLAATGWLPQRVHESRGACATTGHPGRVAEVMRTPVTTIEASAGLVELGRRLLQDELGCLPVVVNGELAGIVTEIDLMQAYRQERSGRRAGAPAADPPVEAIMSVDPLTVHWYTTLGEATRLCRAHGVRHVPVLEASLLVGMVSDRDLRRAHGQGRHEETPVEEIMTRMVFSGPRSMRASEASGLLLQKRISSLCIAERGMLYGIVTTTDILKHDLATRDALARSR